MPEQGYKQGFYVVVSRNFISEDEDVSTALSYSETLGLRSKVVLDVSESLPRECAIRCDFLTLMFKKKLTHFVSTLNAEKLRELDDALCYALGIQS